MPFTVTTKRPTRVDADDLASAYEDRVVSRRAVATLEDARRHVSYASCLPSGRHTTNGHEITESGGSVGPLPDGTSIEVKPITWAEIRSALGHSPKAHEPRTPLYAAALLNAYTTRATA